MQEQDLKDRETNIINKEVMCQVYSEKPWVTVYLDVEKDLESECSISTYKSEICID